MRFSASLTPSQTPDPSPLHLKKKATSDGSVSENMDSEHFAMMVRRMQGTESRKSSSVTIPECFTPYSVWSQVIPDGVVSHARSQRASFNVFEPSVVRLGDTMRDKGCCQSFIVRPSAFKRIAWDLSSVCVMFYDVLLIPMMVFDLKEGSFFLATNWFVTLFWSCDMVFSFFVGFHIGGVIEMRPKKIASRYIKKWFVLDISVLVCDWLAIIDSSFSSDAAGVFRAGKSLRLARVLRVLRLLRILKFMSLIGDLGDFIHSETAIVLIGVLKFVIFILVVNHYIACGWYSIARYFSDYSWVDELRKENESREVSKLYIYTSALHWSFTQFTPASMEVVPTNSLERIYTVSVLVLALVVFSSFLSGITAAMTTLRQMNIDRTRQAEYVRRYITDKKISLSLGNRIYSFLRKTGYVKNTRVLEGDVAALKRLPEQILLDLHSEVFLPVIHPHPFFHHFLVVDEAGLIQVCHHAASEANTAPGQNMFSRAQSGSRLIFIVHGSMTYFFGETRFPTNMGEHEHIAEASLWVHWEHRGHLEAKSICEIVEIRGEDFRDIVRKTKAFSSCQRYAQSFSQRLVAANEVDWGGAAASAGTHSSAGFLKLQVSDLWGNFDMTQELAQQSFEEQMDILRIHSSSGRASQFISRFSSKLRKMSSSNVRDSQVFRILRPAK